MMKKSYIASFIIAIVVMAFHSCSDKWGSHYDDAANGASSNVMELMRSDAQLSKFCQMVVAAGYADMLASSQTFTVFAPVNEALTNVDINDLPTVKRIVLNHIARFNCPVAQGKDAVVKMYNGKRLEFEGLKFGGAVILKADIIAKNGILHVLESQIPYSFNIREYADTHEATSSLSKFISRFDDEVMDIEASRPIGVDASGATIYDSVMTAYNPILQHPVYGLGDIASEDSTFTMLMPDNDAWAKAYERISPYFKVYRDNPLEADSVADVQTSLAIISDLIYRSRVENPMSVTSLISTSGSKITDVASLFADSEKIGASNGLIYLTSQLNYDNTETWNKEIGVEAEAQYGRTPGVGTTVYTRAVTSDQAHAEEISNRNYIEVVGNTSSRNPGVTFSVPNVLSGEYDIVASFVPAVTADASVTGERTKLQFTLTYMDANGRSKTSNFKSDDYVTDSLQMTMMNVGRFDFPISDYYDRLWLSQTGNTEQSIVPTTKLYIVTDVSNADFNSGKYVRQFRLDKIIFIPVKK